MRDTATDHRDDLELARAAYAGCDWPTAVAHFDTLPAEDLSADDLAAYSDAAWWLGRVEDKLRLGAAACDAYQVAGRLAEAAATAGFLAILHLARGDEPTGMGWFGRAGRLLEGIPECPVHGLMVCWTEVEPALMTGQHAAAIDAARRILEIGRRCSDPDLLALGTLSEGRALVLSGRVRDGLALIDEAMVTVLDGRCTPGASGVLYCHTVATCHHIGDFRRLAHWTDLADRWLATLPAAVAFEGLCAVHRAQLQLLLGKWEDVERDALRVAQTFDHQRVDYAAEAWYLVGEARRLRGEASAADAYDEAHARGRDPQPGRALLRLAQGDSDGAATSIRTAVAAVGDDPLLRAPLCAAAVEIAIAAGRLEDAAAAVAHLTEAAATYGTSGLEAMSAGARGALILAQGRAEDALPVLREACRRWHELGAVYDAAGTCQRLAEAYRALGDETSARAEIAQAEAAYDRLGAHRPGPTFPDGLTSRECEVLALVADGRSNKEIAHTLFISDRTVARHLTNVFHKINVTSRTQAARYAIDSGVATSP